MASNNNLSYRGYEAKVEFDARHKILHGHVIGLRDVLLFEANTGADIESEFHATIDEYIDWCKSDGVEPEKPCNGNISLRLTPELHRALLIEADLEGISANQWIKYCLESAVHSAKESRRHVQRVRGAVSNEVSFGEPAEVQTNEGATYTSMRATSRFTSDGEDNSDDAAELLKEGVQ